MNEPTLQNDAIRFKETFEKPQKYLRKTAFNITLRAETVAEFLKNEIPKSILDIGCGDGSLSLPLLKAHNRLTFLDQSKAMLKIAHSRIPIGFSQQVQSVNVDFMSAQLEHQQFDLIICVGVLAYVEHRRDFIAKIKQLLKPGGSLIIECTDVDHFVSRGVLCYHTLRRVLNPSRMRTVVGSSADVLAVCDDLGFKMHGNYRYSLPLPMIRILLTQAFSYNITRFLFGTAARNSNQWLGNECLYYFKNAK